MGGMGSHYAINGIPVTAPDEEDWQPIVQGPVVAGTERRSPYRQLRWTKRVTSTDKLEDWDTYDNTVLTSLICTPPNSAGDWEEYTDAICRSVVSRAMHGLNAQIIATFIVNVGA